MFLFGGGQGKADIRNLSVGAFNSHVWAGSYQTVSRWQSRSLYSNESSGSFFLSWEIGRTLSPFTSTESVTSIIR